MSKIDKFLFRVALAGILTGLSLIGLHVLRIDAPAYAVLGSMALSAMWPV